MNKNSAGFTLLELLVAAALTAVAATVIASAFAAGFRVWQRASATGDGNAVVVLEQLQKDVCNTAPFRLVPFRGGESWVDIPSLVVMSLQDGNQVQPGVVRYEFNTSARTLDRIIRYYPLPGPEQEKRETLMDSVESVRFAYGERSEAGVGSWGSIWSGRTNTPGAIKVTLGYKQGVEQIDRERTMVLPCR